MRLPLALLVCLAVVACPPSASKNPSGSITVADFVARLIDAECGVTASCGTAGLASACAVGLGKSLPDYVKAVAAGRVTFDAQKAQECLDAWSAVDCVRPTPEPPACTAAFTGNVDVGGDCDDDIDCAAGFCDASGPTCPGTCTAFTAVGDPCGTPSQQCDAEAGVLCLSSESELTCVAPADLGEDCRAAMCNPSFGAICIDGTCRAPLEQGGDCSAAITSCARGLTCVQGVCAPPLGEGGLCSFFTTCASGLYCAGLDDPSSLPGPPTCTPTIAQGNACANNLDAFDQDLGRGSGDCGVGLVCAGASADVNGGSLHPGTCQPPAGAGAPCTERVPQFNTVTGCDFGLACTAGVCTALPSTGPCLAGGCAVGSRCTDNGCELLLLTGEPCTLGTDCFSGTCIARDRNVGRCASASSGGSTCAEH